jgi:uncharacterized protein (DUF849 family)
VPASSRPPLIVSAAITGAMTVPSQSPYIPITTDEIVESAVEACEAGAAIVHLHVRGDDGRPSADQELFRKVHAQVSERCDAIVQLTTGGGVGMTIQDRAAVVSTLAPEMATLNCGSFNFGIFPVAERITDWKHDWEREYLEGTRDYIFRNTFGDLGHMSRVMREHGTKPELELYDVGHIYNVLYMLENGLLEPPVHIQFVMGVLGTIGARPEEHIHMRDRARSLLGDHTWSVAGIGYRGQMELATLSMLLGGQVRVGLEDNLRISPDRLAPSNAALVTKILRIATELDRRPATPDEARQILQIESRA